MSELKIKEVSQAPDRVSFSWTGNGQAFRVFKEGKEVYNGPNTEFTDRGLAAGTLYSYFIETEKESLKIQTATAAEREEKNNDIPLQELIITTVIKDSEVAIAWEGIKGVKEYEIYRNGDYAGTVREAGFHDRELNNDDSYTYRVKATRVMQVADEDGTDEPSLISKVIGLIKLTEDEDDALVETFFIDKEIGQLTSHLNRKPANGEKDWFIRYTTFLENKWIPNPILFSKMRLFTGDHRDFNPDSSRYRTRADIKVCGGEVSLARDVSESKGYSWNKQLLEQGKASDEGIEVKDVKEDTEKVSFSLTHSIRNPLVPSPSIVYDVYMTFYKNGVFDLSGEHDEAPHHEVYMKRSDDSWKPLHQSKSRGLGRLAPPTANRFWRVLNMK
jgi:hypothetical protein